MESQPYPGEEPWETVFRSMLWEVPFPELGLLLSFGSREFTCTSFFPGRLIPLALQSLRLGNLIALPLAGSLRTKKKAAERLNQSRESNY